jgi:DNA-binding response OmpR family regulator
MSTKSVLVVEDEFLVALDMEMILTDAGFDVLGPAGSVADALRLINLHQPNAALLDNNLNGQSVSPVADALSARRVPFAFVTGNDRDSLPDAFSDAPLVRKPYDPAGLVAMARRLVE